MQKLITNTVKTLKNEGVILYPTDTVYGIGCDATCKDAVNKVYRIKERSKSKSLIVLVNSFEMLQNYVEEVPKKIINYINDIQEPITVIYKKPKNLAKNLIAKDNTIAIRIVDSGFAHDLITVYKKPIVSTSANISGKITAQDFNAIDKKIKEKVDFIVSLPNYKTNTKPSKIIRLEENTIKVIRA